jgi:hypothetical protein
MKKLFFVLITAMLVFQLPAQNDTLPDGREVESNVSVDANADSIISEVGKVKSFVLVSSDTAEVTNLDGEVFVLVGENVGGLVAEIIRGVEEVKATDPQKPFDWITQFAIWLIGGGFVSLMAYGTRAWNGLKSIFAGVEKDYKIVIGVAGTLAIGWQLVQGMNIAEAGFWQSFASLWLMFAGAAFVLYNTILKRIFRTPPSPAKQEAKFNEAIELLSASGAIINFPKANM